MKIYYDLHIHSALSPCGSEDMTPNNIVNMAYIKGLNVISVTDHNSINNYLSIKKVADKRNIIVIPGMEVTSKEEVHLLCYFHEYKDAKKISDYIYQSLPKIKNKPSIFGEQYLYSEDDEIIGTEDKLLTSSSSYSISEIFDTVIENNGIVIPAHIDKLSNGIIGVLGFIPNNINIKYVEVIDISKIDKSILNRYEVVRNSDAHMLHDISEPNSFFIADNISKFLENFFE